MKTNTFIFNFINPSRLAYFAGPAGGSTVSESSPVQPEKNETPLELLENAEREYQESWKKVLEAQNEMKKAKESDDIQKAAELMANANRELENTGRRFAELRGEQLARMENDPWAKTADINKSARKIDKDDLWASEINKNAVETILADKKSDLEKLLKSFSGKEYKKGDWSKYNFKVLAILGKKDADNKKEWIKAFQEWADAKGDGAVGPNTMLALAKKMNMSEYENKIEGTMIAKRAERREPFAEMYTEEKRSKAREHYGTGKDLYESDQYAEALAEFQAAYNLIPHPSALSAIAECQYQLGKYDLAKTNFNKINGKVPSNNQIQVEKRLKDIENISVLANANLRPASDSEAPAVASAGETSPAKNTSEQVSRISDDESYWPPSGSAQV